MKQVVQPLAGGNIKVIEVPAPIAGPTEVLVRTSASLISAGTEGSITKLAQASLVSKAKARPDLVRQVMKKAKTEGISATVRSVKSRLDEYLPLGYSAAGVALEVGETVSGVRPGQHVATGGAGKANHAEFQAIPGLLAVPLPDGVSDESAAFATLGSIALHGLRLADLQAGSNVVVVGLGLVGQLTARLAVASGHRVLGIDVNEFQLSFTEAGGAKAIKERGPDTTRQVNNWSNGRGADAVIITAGGKSSEPIMRTPELCRDRAIVVVVGDVGLELQRAPFYEKELTIRFARSYGPGRYDLAYEGWAVDYPDAYVRWTEGRNLQAVLGLIASERLKVDDLVTHRFDISDAAAAYKLIEEKSEPFLGLLLTYRQERSTRRSIEITHPKMRTSGPSVGLIGAGSFARSVLLPSMRAAGFDRFVAVASASGVTARRIAEMAHFEKVAEDAGAIIDDPDVDLVVIATPHDTHASLTVKALRANKHVFCEKPLALTMDELDQVENALAESGGSLFIGFNRRWSGPIQMVKDHLSRSNDPLVITYRVNAGPVPDKHWYNDRRQGGRLIGEACHFIDTCVALVDLVPVHVSALGDGTERLLSDNFVISLGFGDGSLASITYGAGGHPGSKKERVEILGRGCMAEVIDFSSVKLNGTRKSFRGQDKGHLEEMSQLRHQIGTGHHNVEQQLGSMRATIRAAHALLGVPEQG